VRGFLLVLLLWVNGWIGLGGVYLAFSFRFCRLCFDFRGMDGLNLAFGA
jgi:hypothetical protein